MGFFKRIGDNIRQDVAELEATNRCKQRCKAELGWNPTLERQCLNGCKADSSFQPGTVLQDLPPDVSVGYFGIDDFGGDICGLPENKGNPQCQDQGGMSRTWIYVGIAAAVLVLILMFRK